MNQVVVKYAKGRQRPRTLRVEIDGRILELDLRHRPNLVLAVELGYVFPGDENLNWWVRVGS